MLPSTQLSSVVEGAPKVAWQSCRIAWTLSFCFFKREIILRRKEKFSPKVGDGFDPEGVGPMSHSL